MFRFQNLSIPLFQLALLASIWMFGTEYAKATHAMGGEITYECIGPNRYRIILDAYRDCNGVNLGTNATLRYRSATCNVNTTVSMTRQGTPVDITPFCGTAQTRCQTTAANPSYGVERWRYVREITLPAGCGDDWILSWELCCRNNAINTLNNPGGQRIHIETRLNNTLPNCNNSPQFLNIPTAFNCNNGIDSVFYNHGVFDPDGDSLDFNLVPCQRAANTSANYAGGFTGASPLGTGAPITIDPRTGAIAFLPNANRVAVVCVRVDEYRNGVLIGSVTRDMQLTIFACNNFLPQSSAPFATTGGQTVIDYEVTSCFGTQFCFDIESSDANIDQVLTVSWNGGIPGATFVPGPPGNPVTSRFCWTPQASNVGLNFFTVNVQDDACPVVGENTFTYTINVIANPNPPVDAGPNVTICRGQTTTLTASTTAPPATINRIEWTPAVGLTSPNSATTDASPLSTTTYTATVYYNDGCQSTDEVTVTVIDQPVVSVAPNNVNVCPGSNITLIASTDGPGNTFAWSQGATPLGSGTISGTASTLATTVPTTAGVYTYTVVVTNPLTGCSSTESTDLVVGIPPAEPQCINIYVSPTGSPAASGTILDPTNLFTALDRSACNNAVIKLAQGIYEIDEPLNITSLVTVEGGFDPANLWDKTSTPGATVIRRTRNNPEGVVNDFRLIALSAIGATGFRLQDLTIETVDADEAQGDFGMTTYGLYMNGCSNYTVARVQVRAGNAGDGRNGIAGVSGIAGANGGNGADGNTLDNQDAGGGGTGGNGGSSGAIPAGGFGGAPGVTGSAGNDGTNPNPASRAGGAGAGGGAGGTVNSPIAYQGYPGGSGGAGATGAGLTPTNGAFGFGGNGGNPGLNGTDAGFLATLPAAANGTNGTLNPTLPNTTTVFYQPGGQGTAGTNGTGGQGGAGGGGGGGQNCAFGCVRGSGNGGGGGGGGEGGAGATGGFSGGGSFGVYAVGNLANGNFIDCNIQAGTAGAGGTGGAGGVGGTGGAGAAGAAASPGEIGAGGAGGFGQTGGNGGNGGNGRPGVAQAMVVNGTALVTSSIAFNLAAQPEIVVRNVNCTEAPVQFTSNGAPTGSGVTSWVFDVDNGFAVPPTAINNPDSTEYDSVARYTIANDGNIYTGFHNIAFSGAFRPDIITSANQIGVDTFQLCEGQFATFESSRFADTAIWDFGGAIPNPANILAIPSTQFNNPGFYMITLLLITDCCGDAPQDTIWLYVDPLPNATGSGDVVICQDEIATLSLTGLQPTDSVIWSPTSNLNQVAPNQVTVRPVATTTYTASVYTTTDMGGGNLRISCPQTINFLVTVNPRPDPTLTSVDVLCNDDGSATATLAGGGPYNFQWETGAVDNGLMSSTITNLAAGVYLITVTDASTGCDTIRSIFVAPAPAQPQAVVQTTVDVTCTGFGDGQATVGTVNGTAPFTYTWSNGFSETTAGTSTQTGLAPGSYCVTSTDDNGCFSNVCLDIVEPSVLANNTISVTDPTCVHTDNGFIEVEGLDGTGLITYEWSAPAGQTGQINPGLLPGTYTVTLTDANSCTLSETYTLNPQNVLNTNIAVTDSILCNGGTGEITVNADGGSGLGTFNYTWAGGTSAAFPNTTDVVTGAEAASYTVTVTDLNSCTISTAVTVTEPTELTATIPSTVSVTCFGANTGEATADASGGVGPYTYIWGTTPVQNTAIATGLVAGSYTVTVEDANGCTTTATTVIAEPAAPLLANASVSSNYNGADISCFGASDASVAVSAAGGTTAYSYEWSDAASQTTASATGLAEGTYTVTVTDANLCSVTADVTVTEPSQVDVTVPSSVSVTCFGASTGEATAAGIGGTGTISYLWSDAAAQTTVTATGLAEGTYTVTATDFNLCTATVSVDIFEPATAVNSNASVVSNYNGSEVSCAGASDGEAEVVAGGGTPGYTYAWSDAATQTTPVATGLAAGAYTVTVTDANACTSTALVTVTEPNPVAATISSTVSVTCFGASTGEATVNPAGGTGAYSFLWNTGPTQSTVTATGLAVGSYVVTVTDANSCTASAVATIVEPVSAVSAVASVTSNYNGAQISCFGEADGSAEVLASGGTPGYTYLWSDAAGTVTADVTGLPAGTYQITVNDANSCELVRSVTVTEPSAVTASIASNTSVTCLGEATGAATAQSAGGTGTYNYVWDNAVSAATNANLIAGTYCVTVTDVNACPSTVCTTIAEPATAVAVTATVSSNYNGQQISCFGASDGEATATGIGGTGLISYNWSTAPAQTTAIATGLAATTYAVTATDENNCQAVSTVVLSEPSALTVTPQNQVNVSCFGNTSGSVEVVAAGGSAPYAYLWSNGATSAQLNNVAAGNYCVTVTDANSCEEVVCVNITQPTAAVTIAASASSNYNGFNVSCNGGADGTADAFASGGTGLLAYLWDNGQTTTVATGLSAGTSCLTVTDANGCSASACVSLNQPLPLNVTLQNVTNVACRGESTGDILVQGVGGVGSYTYTWSNGATSASNVGLVAGAYCVTVADANACEDVTCVTITEPATAVTVTAGVTSSYNGQDVSCFGIADGEATATGGGGSGAITYLWNIGAQITATATGLADGVYCVTATDSRNCSASACVTLTEPSEVTATITSTTDVSCFAAATGQATVAAAGGTGGIYSFNWSTGNTGTAVSSLVADIYSVTATDVNGCEGVATFSITEPAFAIDASAVVTSNYNGSDVSCFNDRDGIAEASATGGTVTTGYSYQWGANTGGQTTAIASGLRAGVYGVTVTDNNGCSDNASITVTQPVLVVGNVANVVNVNCFGDCTGAATIQGTGGAAPYSFLWEAAAANQTTATATGLCAGSYNVTLTDANGCSSAAVAVIGQPISTIDASIAVSSNYNGAQISCAGATDGELTVTATDGTAPYTYLWSNGQTSTLATGFGAGTAEVTVTDAQGCAIVVQETLVAPSPVTSSVVDVIQVDCRNAATGSARVAGAGGTAPYSYEWSNGQLTALATGLAAGSYDVTVTDANGCFVASSVNITEPTTVLAAAATVSSNYNGAQLSCATSSDGEVTASAAGGTAPYNYAWSASASSQLTAIATAVPAGTHTVTITDANGCETTASSTVVAPTVVLAQITATNNVSCFNGANGSATASGNGGVGSYSYLWQDGQITATATGLNQGSYNVTVADANGCSSVAVATINQPAASVLASAVATSNYNGAQISCQTATDGEATASATGGSAPYTFLWSDGQNTLVATGLAPGSYSVTVTDNQGCTNAATVVLSVPSAVQAVLASSIDVDCRGTNTGQATIAGQGGTGAYSFEWSDGQLTATATGLITGSYDVTVTDANGCAANINVVINQPAQALVLGASVTSNYNGAQISCPSATDGIADVIASGGSAPYSYEWSNASLGATSTGLGAGTHTVTVTDANGCSANESVTILAPTAVGAAVVASTDVDCSGNATGSATVAGTGGTGGTYTYEWDLNAVGQTTATATALAAGSYTVTVTDTNGCSVSTVASISVPASVLSASVVVSSDYNGAQVSCFSASDGELTASVSGGTAPYNALWSDGQTGFAASNLSAGNYCVTITDNNGCQAVRCETIQEPTVVQVSLVNQVNVACFANASGSAQVAASGGTGAYSYEWSTTPAQLTATATGLAAAAYNVTASDANGCQTVFVVNITEPASGLDATTVVLSNYNGAQLSCTSSSDAIVEVTATGGIAPYSYLWFNGAATATVSALPAGTHSVTVTDANLCQVVRTVTVTAPAAIALTTSTTPVNCFGSATGTATVNATGGTGTYSYLWPDGQNTQTAVNYAQGSYVVTVTDANGCVRTATATVSQPANALSTSTSVVSPYNGQQISCQGASDGQATVIATGGAAPYNYLWSDGQATASATGLSAGTYCVTVTDANSCISTNCVTVTEPTQLNASVASQTDAACAGTATGVATIAATGGTGAYSYEWSTGTLTVTDNALPAGLHVVTVTDLNGCQDILSLTINEPTQAVGVQIVQNTTVSCNGSNDASVQANAFGGTAPYSYQWSPNAQGAITAAVTGLSADVYNVTVTDAVNCQTIGTVTITEPSAVTASIATSTNVSCRGAATGTATAQGQGGTAPYSFAWTNGLTTQTIANLSAGSYQVTVADANGCAQTVSVVINQPASGIDANASVSSNYNGQQISCTTASDGEAQATVVNGTAPYNYLWSDGQATALATGLAAGGYCVTVTDDNGCSDVACVTLTAPSQVTATIVSSTPVDCRGNATGSLAVAGNGGAGAYTYLWDANANNQVTATATNLAAGFYCVTVTDINGCAEVVCATVSEPLVSLTANASVSSNYNGQQVSCFGSSDGSISASATGGTAPYSYFWSAGNQTTASVSAVAAGAYEVTVTDARGCEVLATVTVSEPSAVTATATANNNVSCLGLSDGSASVAGTGGTAPYAFAWSTGATVATIVNLPANAYTVTITDANGCASTSSVVITEPASGVVANAAVISNYNGAQVSCENSNDGSAEVSGLGGVVATDYSYQWDGFAANQTTAIATGLRANVNYQVTVTDDNGCFAVASVSLTEPSAVTATATSTDPVACVGASTGQALASGAGGTGAYGYFWSVNAQTTAAATGLPAGLHTVTVTDANGCQATSFVTITQPSNSLTVNTAVTSSYGAGTQITCFGATDGTVEVTATGGEAPYFFQWSANAGNATSATVTGLGAGTYTVTVTDDAGCEQVSSVSLSAPAALNASIVGQLDVSCRNQSTGVVTIEANAGTGTPGYTYTINAPVPSNNGTFSGLAAGAYTVTVTDLNFCSTTVPVLITQPATSITTAASVTSSYNGQNISCAGASDGEATVIANNGTAPYSYQWNASASNQTTAVATGLAAGSYSVVVTDDNGCVSTASVTLTEPSVLSASLISTSDVLCATDSNGTARINAANGTPGYTYEVVGQSNSNGQFSGLGAGNYIATVTDANGCSTTVPFIITSPSTLDVTISVTSDYNGQQISCNNACDAAATAVATGGTGTYSFVWSNGQTSFTASALCSTPSVTVTDQSGCTANAIITLTEPSLLTASIVNQVNIGCNGASSGSVQIQAQGATPTYSYDIGTGAQANGIFTNLAAGNYDVTVTDVNGCQTTVAVSITQGSAVNATVAVTSNYNGQAVTCASSADAEATVTATGGAAPYTFFWSNGQTTATATGLAVGTYEVTITDANGCDLVRSVDVTAPNALAISVVTQTDVLCAGTATGSFRVEATGGVAPYIYSINNGNSFTNTVEYTNLAAATYCVIVRDANGCEETVCATINEPALLQGLITNQVDVSCNGIADGTVTVEGTGGVGPYLYDFNFNGVFLPDNSFSNLNAGNYTIRVRDANNCVFNVPVQISQPTPLVLNLVSSTAPNCAGACNGTIEVAASGGTAGYEYSIDGTNFSASAVFTNLCGGTYTLSTRDAQGCVRTRTVTLNQPNVLTATATVTSNYNGRQISCFGATDGTAQVVAAGGSLPYNYQWSMGATTASVTGLAANVGYGVTITDANGCTAQSSVTLTEPTELAAGILAQTNVSCGGGTDGSVTVAATQGTGTGPYTYDIGTGATTQNTFTNLVASGYIITVTDANGCATTLPVNITEPAPISINALSITSNYNGADVSCTGSANATAAVQAAGGSGTLSYLWSNGQTTTSATGLAAGVLTVRVTDANGCSVSGTITVTEPSPLNATLATTNAGCFGGNQGEITATATGGTAPYTYSLNGAAPQVANNFTGLGSGTYTVVITDANGCSISQTTTISQSSSLNVAAAISSNYNGQDLSCAGASDASASVVVSGGTAPYIYLWSNGQATAAATGLPAGVASVTVTDAAGCDIVASVTVTEPSAVSLTVATVGNADCATAPSGRIVVSGAGGAGNYTYASSVGSNSTGEFNALLAGSYTITVTDANGCSATTSATVSEPAAININFAASNVSCFGLQDGQVTTSASGGTPFSNGGYLYAWNNGSTARNIGNLGAGTYSVTVTDASGCTVSEAGVVTEPLEIVASITDITHVGCNGSGDGSVEVTAVGGSGNFEFSSNGGQSYQAGTSPFTFNNLAGGTYSIVIRDAANASCEIVRTVEVLEGSPIEVSVTTNGVACAGDATGSATVQTAGGSGTYTYLWSDGQTTVIATGLASNLEDGVFTGNPYSVTVSDANGCTAAVDNIGISSPEVLAIAAELLQEVSCFAGTDGAAFVTIQGGAPGAFDINWSNGATTDTIRNVEAFNYTVVVTDANGCTDTATVAISEPTFPLIAALSGDTTSCFGGTDGVIAIDSIIGGTPINGSDYEFSFEEEGPYGSAAILSQGLPAGQYTVYVRDENECVTSVSDIFIRQPADISVQAYNNATILLGETVELYATTTGGNFDSSLVTWSYVDEFGDLVEACRGENCLNSFTPDVNILFETRTFIVDLGNGCEDTSSVLIQVDRQQTLFVPNAFTPNGDGLNDVFMPYASTDVAVVNRFMVFDRWGELVHEASDFVPGDFNAAWDGNFRGKKMNQGVFIYYVEAKLINGEPIVRKGDVTLMR